VNEYGEKCRKAGAFFQPLVVEVRPGGMSETTTKIIGKHAMLAGHRMGSDPVSAQVAAETEHQGSGPQREPCRNVHAVPRGQPRGKQALGFNTLSWCGRCGWEATHDWWLVACRR
jgi:hypothetical protein